VKIFPINFAFLGASGNRIVLCGNGMVCQTKGSSFNCSIYPTFTDVCGRSWSLDIKRGNLSRKVSSNYHSYFFHFLYCIFPNTFLSAISSVVGSVLVISGMYMLLWGKSKDRGQCALKDTQENQKDEECH
jgi:hypothetical protein